jgi:hypothetical protein
MAARRPFRLLLIAFGEDLPGPGIDDIVRAAAFAGRVQQLIIDVLAIGLTGDRDAEVVRSP